MFLKLVCRQALLQGGKLTPGSPVSPKTAGIHHQKLLITVSVLLADKQQYRRHAHPLPRPAMACLLGPFFHTQDSPNSVHGKQIKKHTLLVAAQQEAAGCQVARHVSTARHRRQPSREQTQSSKPDVLRECRRLASPMGVSVVWCRPCVQTQSVGCQHSQVP